MCVTKKKQQKKREVKCERKRVLVYYTARGLFSPLVYNILLNDMEMSAVYIDGV